MSAQAIAIRIIAIVILVGLWNQLSETSWFALPPTITNGGEVFGRVLSDAGVSAASRSKFISAKEAVLILSPQEQGIFLYLNAEGKFYPEYMLQNVQEVQDTIEGFSFTVVSGKGAVRSQVRFDSPDHPAYEYTSFEDARTLLPELQVFTHD